MLALTAGDIIAQVLICAAVVFLYHMLFAARSAPVAPQAAPKPVEAPKAAPAPVAPQLAAAPKSIAVEAPKPVVETPRPAASSGEAIPAEIIAVIAAAISTFLDRPHRVLSVLPAAPAPVTHSPWALEGRTDIFQSHRVR